FSDFVYHPRGHPATFRGLFLVALIFLSALLGPFVIRYDPYGVNLADAALAPSLAHPFGTDQYGEDVLTRVIVAARLDLVMVLSAVLLSPVIGVTSGALAACFGHYADDG